MSLETFASDLAAYLETQGIGTRGTSLFVGELPATTTDAVLVRHYSAGGNPTDVARGIDFVNVQVTARASTYAAANALAHDVHAVISEQANVTVGWTYCKPLQNPTPLGVDERSLWRFACNYRFHVPR